MIKGAIFDVDGTLLDSMEIWEEVGVRYLHSIGVEPETNLSEILFPMTVEEGVGYVKRQYQLPQTISEITDGVLDIVRDFYLKEASLKKGAKELLEFFAKQEVAMVAATSSDRKFVEAAFHRLHISQYFKEIFTCSEVGVGKTNPFIYEAAAKCLGTAPQETYVFEDVLHAIQTANKAGFYTVGIYDRTSEKDKEEIRKQADIYLTDFTEIIQREKENEK